MFNILEKAVSLRIYWSDILCLLKHQQLHEQKYVGNLGVKV